MALSLLERRRRARGFSLIEILVAVVVSAIGFSAVFALQMSTMRGNVAAREQAAALTLAEASMERLRAEAYEWTSTSNPTGKLNTTLHAPRVWHLFSDTGPVDQNGLPFGGNGTPGSGLARQRFCVHYFTDPQAGTFAQILSVRVRVVWPRSTMDNTGLDQVCTEAGATAFVDAPATWNSVTLPGAVRMRD